jgi:hypothetical protein
VKKIAQGSALVLLLFSFFAVPGIAQRDWIEITPYDNSFSFLFPQKIHPDRKERNIYGLHAEILTYSTTIQKGGHIFIANRTRFHHMAKIEVGKELQDNANAFSKRLDGKIVWQKNFNWKRGEGDELPALEASTETSHGIFRQLYLMDGNFLFALTAGPIKPENTAEIERFFASLKIPKR